MKKENIIKKLSMSIITISILILMACSSSEDKSNSEQQANVVNEKKDTVITGQIKKLFCKFYTPATEASQMIGLTLYNDSVHNYFFEAKTDGQGHGTSHPTYTLVINNEVMDIFNLDENRTWIPNTKYLDNQVKITCVRTEQKFENLPVYFIHKVEVTSNENKNQAEQEYEGIITGYAKKGKDPDKVWGFFLKRNSDDTKIDFIKVKDLENPKFNLGSSSLDIHFEGRGQYDPPVIDGEALNANYLNRHVKVNYGYYITYSYFVFSNFVAITTWKENAIDKIKF